MNKFLGFRLSTPFMLYLASLALHQFANEVLPNAGWQLLNLALLESVICSGQSEVPLWRRCVMLMLSVLWVVKVVILLLGRGNSL